MTLQQLRQVLTIAESNSMNEAAKKLFVSQPNLSATVREVENAVLKVETTPSAYPNISAVSASSTA